MTWRICDLEVRSRLPRFQTETLGMANPSVAKARVRHEVDRRHGQILYEPHERALSQKIAILIANL